MSAGLLAWVPFAHAVRRLGGRSRARKAFGYGCVAVVMGVLAGLTPTDAEGDPVGVFGEVLSVVTGVTALAVMVTAVVQQAPLRREVYEGSVPVAPKPPVTSTAPGPSGPPGTVGNPVTPAVRQDPAVAAVLAARRRREESRALAAEDPLMARELGIGRPDVTRKYDDGGLVDLNSAPAEVIAQVCGLDVQAATEIERARAHQPGGFSSVDEVLVLLELPVGAWDALRDRAVLLPPR
ncbi:hypothetical protein [Actinopolyspora erythraea]|uniref:hypothetical protein n=1 Tax=Actinopolyspora erythraea TaxID=414996 RepID=UPI0018DF1EE2|nr:hypothetical protein [Actinopolyspora erythraea]